MLRVYRRQSRDPMRGGLLTQARLGELIGDELGDAGYTGAAVSDWEREKSRISAADRTVLVAIIGVLQRCGGLTTPAEADDLLAAGDYRTLNETETEQLFGLQHAGSSQPEPSPADPVATAQEAPPLAAAAPPAHPLAQAPTSPGERLDGFSVCRRIREQADTPIILLTVRSEEDDIVHGLKLGADDYIAKPFSPRQLVARVHAVLRRAGRSAAPVIRQVGELTLDLSRRELSIGEGEAVSLTPLEGRLLDYLMLNAGHVLTAEAIITHVWGAEGGDRDMLRQLVHRLRGKIAQAHGPEAGKSDQPDPVSIQTIPGLGYGLTHLSLLLIIPNPIVCRFTHPPFTSVPFVTALSQSYHDIWNLPGLGSGHSLGKGSTWAESGLRKAEFLVLDNLTVDPGLAHRLPGELAWRFHALPVAEERGRTTVAMADPDDHLAREAVVAVLGPGTQFVRGNPAAIDSQLAAIWKAKAGCCPEVWLCSFTHPASDQARTYAQSLAYLLDARLRPLDEGGATWTLKGQGWLDRCDLLVTPEAGHPRIRELLSHLTGQEMPAGHRSTPFGLLVAPEPRWPLQHILLILGGDEADQAAVDWVVCLARRSGSAVTVLAVVPPAPAMYGRRAPMDQGLAALLSSATPLGCQMRQAARRIVEHQVHGTLQLRQGVPDWEIGRELDREEYDLIAVAAAGDPWWRRWLEGDQIASVLRRASQPLLVAKPRIAGEARH